MKTFEIVKTNKGFPALWEQGGLNRKTILISSADGRKKVPMFIIKKKGVEKHALFKVEKGDLITETFSTSPSVDPEVKIYRVEEVDVENMVVKTSEFNGEITKKITTLIKTSMQKAKMEGCYKPCFYFKRKKSFFSKKKETRKR